MQTGHHTLQLRILPSLPLQTQLDVIIRFQQHLPGVFLLLTGTRDTSGDRFAKGRPFSKGRLTDESEWQGRDLGMGRGDSKVDENFLLLLVRGEEETLLDCPSSQSSVINCLKRIFFWFSSPTSKYFSSLNTFTLNNNSLFSFFKVQFSPQMSLANFNASLISSLTDLYSSSDNFFVFLISTSVRSSISFTRLPIIASISPHRFANIRSESVLNRSISSTNLFHVSWPQLPWPLTTATWLSYFSSNRENSSSMLRLRLRQSSSCRSASSRRSISTFSMDYR